mmetsp:Transcript_4731/g.14565  ORF Transcript_4731/g.14565 Transcript_4731/m.14565 type:complete len:202 (+) Transcript_4731:63-668(+)
MDTPLPALFLGRHDAVLHLQAEHLVRLLAHLAARSQQLIQCVHIRNARLGAGALERRVAERLPPHGSLARHLLDQLLPLERSPGLGLVTVTLHRLVVVVAKGLFRALERRHASHLARPTVEALADAQTRPPPLASIRLVHRLARQPLLVSFVEAALSARATVLVRIGRLAAARLALPRKHVEPPRVAVPLLRLLRLGLHRD